MQAVKQEMKHQLIAKISTELMAFKKYKNYYYIYKHTHTSKLITI